MKELKLIRLMILLMSILFVMILLASLYPSQSMRLSVGQPAAFNHGWVYADTEGDVLLSELPTRVEAKAYADVKIKTILNDDFLTRQTLLIRSSLQDVTVMLEGVIIYEKILASENNVPPYASLWHTVEIPGHSEGKELSITYHTPYSRMAGVINDVYYGTEAQLYTHLFQTYGFRLAIGSLTLLSGILMISISVIYLRKNNKGFVYVGLYTLFLGGWILGESRMIQWFIGSQWIIGSISYLMLALFPIPMLIYLRDFVIRKYKLSYDIALILFACQVSLIVIFQVTGVMDFFDSVLLTQLMLVLTFSMLVITLALEMKQGNERALTVLKYLAFLLVFGFLELITFLRGNFNLTSTFLLIGISLIMVWTFISYFRYLIVRLRQSFEKDLYERLAFEDFLTGGRNRLAFERDLDALFHDKEKREKLCIMYFDLDDLKHVNDTYGHAEGDTYLRRAFDMISDNYQSFGECYRIGGDEFACIFLGVSKIEIEKQRYLFMTQMQQEDAKLPYHFHLSQGFVSYQESDTSTKILIGRADALMYKNKKHSKEIHDKEQREIS